MADDDDQTFDAGAIDAEIGCRVDELRNLGEPIDYIEIAGRIERDLIAAFELGVGSPDPCFWREVIAELHRRASKE